MIDKTVRTTARRLLGRDLVKEDGIREQIIRMTEERLGIRLPKALREFYALVGNLEMFFSSFQFFIDLDELEIRNGKMVFLVENQGVCYWALSQDDDWQRVYVRIDALDESEWYKDLRIDDFMYVIMFLQCSLGGYQYSGVVDVEDFEDRDDYALFLQEIVKDWEKVFDQSGFISYFKEQKIIWHFINRIGRKDDTIYAAALTYEGMKELLKYGFTKV